MPGGILNPHLLPLPPSPPGAPPPHRHKCPFSFQNGSAGLRLPSNMSILSSGSRPHKGPWGGGYPELEG